MEKLFDNNAIWYLSRYAEDTQQVEEKYFSKLHSKEGFYPSNFACNFSLKSLVLKTSLEFHFKRFFDPMTELLAVALFWDCTGTLIVSKAKPIYISKNNSRKLNDEIQQYIPKGIKGALVVQLFVLEYELEIEPFLLDLPIKMLDYSIGLEEQITTHSFEGSANFLAQTFLQTAASYQVEGHELFRKSYPSFQLNQYFEEEKESPFYNLVIQIEPWQN